MYIRQLLQFTVTIYKLEITETILITNILLIWRVQFMEIDCQGVRKWKKKRLGTAVLDGTTKILRGGHFDPEVLGIDFNLYLFRLNPIFLLF